MKAYKVCRMRGDRLVSAVVDPPHMLEYSIGSPTVGRAVGDHEEAVFLFRTRRHAMDFLHYVPRDGPDYCIVEGEAVGATPCRWLYHTPGRAIPPEPLSAKPPAGTIEAKTFIPIKIL